MRIKSLKRRHFPTTHDDEDIPNRSTVALNDPVSGQVEQAYLEASQYQDNKAAKSYWLSGLAIVLCANFSEDWS